MKVSVDILIKRFSTIKSNRSQWDNHWQECAKYCLPQKAIITQTRTPGTKLDTEIYDSTAVDSIPIISSGLHSYMTNPSSRWFALRMEDKELNDVPEVKDWLKKSEDAIFDSLNSSNFNEIITEWYVDFAVFGNACLYIEEDFTDDVVFFVRPMAEIYILINDKGRIDTVYREFTFTARQAYQKWGKESGKKVLDLIEAGKVEEPVTFLHIVLPRDERDVGKKDSRNMPVASLYVEPTTKKILSEGGYEEFPFFITRFYKVSDSEYAYSPASMALADIKMLNQMSKDILEAAQKTLNPPIVLPHDGYLMPFKTTANSINYKLQENAEDKIEALQLNREIGLSLEMENQRRKRIERSFFVDLFLMMANIPDKQRTATEIVERVNERMMILGPALGRLMKTLSGIIIRIFNILLRAGKIPQPPEILQGRDYKVEYISPLAKAQRRSEIKAIDDLLLGAKAIGEIAPEAVDNFDADKAMKRIAEIGYTSDLLRDEETVAQIRAMRAEQMKIQQEVELAAKAAPAVKTAIEAEKELKGGEGGAEPE